LRSGGYWFEVKLGKKFTSQRKKLGVVMYTFHHSYGRKHKIEILKSRLAWAKSETPISRIIRAKEGWSLVQMVKCLPRNCKALSSNPGTTHIYTHTHTHTHTQIPSLLCLIICLRVTGRVTNLVAKKFKNHIVKYM
jgi:hypothetical protein